MLKLAVNNHWFSKYFEHQLLSKFIFLDPFYLNQIQQANIYSKAINLIRLANGTFKTTASDRLIEVDEKLICLLERSRTYNILDVGASDGVTSAELFIRLEQRSIQSKITFTDKYASLFYQKRLFDTLYFDSDNTFLFARVGPILADGYLPNHYIFSKILGFLYRKKSSVKRNLESIPLINPMATTLIDEGKLTFEFMDVTDLKVDGKYDLIRCMNILNPRYFSATDLKTAILKFAEHLSPGGILIIGRTNGEYGLNNVSFYKKIDDQLSCILNINKGSEIHDIVNKAFK